MKLTFVGTRQELLSYLRILCLLEGDKPVLQLLAELGAGRGAVH
jgi:hypothetical protein